LATIAIYLTACGYLSYLIALWALDMMLPKVTAETLFMEDGHEFTQTQTPFYFGIEAYG
jgi:hypothetical protein